MKTAHVLLTVTHFRSLTAPGEDRYVEATTTLAPHDKITLVDHDGMPTLVCPETVDIELTVASATPGEDYVPLSVSFQQRGDIQGDKRDKTGALNFERLPATAGKLLFRNKRLIRGSEGRYEFFVLIQRMADGAIGLIDPGIVNEPI